MNHKEFDQYLKKQEVSPLYFLYGEEKFLIERYSQILVDRLIEENDRDFNLDSYQGSDIKGDELLSSALSLPMFAERRVLWVKHAEQLTAGAVENISYYLSSPSPSTSIIFQAEKVDSRKSFYSELKKKSIWVEFKKVNESEAALFAESEVKRRGKRIDRDALDQLIFLVGNNLQDMASQIEKASLYVGQSDRISVEHIKMIASDSRIDNIFVLTDSLGSKQLDKSIRALSLLLRDGNSSVYILIMLIRHFRQIWLVRSELDRGAKSTEAICSNTGLSPYIAGKLIPAAKLFSKVELGWLFRELLVADLNVKGGIPFPSLALEQMVVSICERKREGQIPLS